MILKKFDFLSNAPHNYIFQTSSNKTVFGGVYFMLYIIGIIGFSIYCNIKFIRQDNFSIENSYYMYILLETILI